VLRVLQHNQWFGRIAVQGNGQRCAQRLLLFLLCLGLAPYGRSYGQTQVPHASLDQVLEAAGTAQAAGQYSQAALLYARATAIAPEQPELWSNRGVMECLAGSFSPSILSLKHALALDPDLFVPQLFLGRDYVQLDKPVQALVYLDKAHTLQPSDSETLLSLGKAHLDLGHAQAAAGFYTDAARAAPKDTDAWFGLGVSSLGVINQAGEQMAATKAQSLWARALYADELFAQNRPLEAVSAYTAALAAATPVQKQALTGNLAWMQAHPELFPLPPDSQAALQSLNAQLAGQAGGTAAQPCRDVDQAKQKARKSVADKLVTRDGAALLNEASCAFQAGQYGQSATFAEQALPQPASQAEALYWLIKANERIAVAALARFEELSPQSAASFVLVGNLYHFQRQDENALGEYQKALAVDPQDASALLGDVLAYFALDKLDQATASDRSALASRPDDPQLNLLMAEILDAQGHQDQAEPYLAKCADAPPEQQPRVHYLLSHVYAQQGRTTDAIEQLKLALPGDKDGSIHYQLARLYRKAGNAAEAEDMFAQARALIAKRDANAAIATREETATQP
jgi:tetratricopeptide (TPR) repeat protein